VVQFDKNIEGSAMDKKLLQLYVDGLLSTFSRSTATSFSALVDGEYSHDAITRFLSNGEFSSRDLWFQVKSVVRSIESPFAVLIVDDSISHKPHMDESEIVGWYYDHTSGRSVKGINLISVLYHSEGLSIPVSCTIVKKTKIVVDSKTGKEKRVSVETKNDHFRTMLSQCRKNVKFRYVLSDVWYASVENMKFIKHELRRDFVMPLKTNRKVALSASEKRAGRYVTVDTLRPREHEHITIYLEGLTFPVLLIRHVYKNKDGSEGVLYLCCSDITLTYQHIIDLYQKRWKIEEYHKALKQQCALSVSPAHTVNTQSTHIFCSLCAFVKLELMHRITAVSYEGLKLNLYIHAMKTAHKYLKSLQPIDWATKPIFA
jgi:hypothetical protein